MRESVQCSVMYGDPPFVFTWYKDNQKLIENQGLTTRKFDEFTSTLVISKVNADSNGNYTCRVSNSAGFDEQSAVLSVKESENHSKTIEFEMKERDIRKNKSFPLSGELDVGMRASVQCAVIYGDPPFQIWDSKNKSFHFPGELDVGMRTTILCAVIYGDPPLIFLGRKMARYWQENAL
ncbi:titin [Caerostris extrusa]|uniref:Titin n=1 Tax=Caerostris extrusa TaxID=172846 RepID=A0AAV4S0U7_CAEEX|nr:titin [Caerostris extrusa]